MCMHFDIGAVCCNVHALTLVQFLATCMHFDIGAVCCDVHALTLGLIIEMLSCSDGRMGGATSCS